MTQPQGLKTKTYIYGVESVNGYDAWRLFEACARDEVSTVKGLLEKDHRLVNAQYWYRFPIHLSVFAGNAEIVQLLLRRGANPGESIYTYDSWDKLLLYARERGYQPIEMLLQQAMKKKFNYSPDFDELKSAMVEFLLNRGAATNLPGDEPWATPLAWATRSKRADIVDLLKLRGAK